MLNANFDTKNIYLRRSYYFSTPIRQLPKINGREIDLLKFYNQVTALGGLQKVSKFFLLIMWTIRMYCLQNFSESDRCCRNIHGGCQPKYPTPQFNRSIVVSWIERQNERSLHTKLDFEVPCDTVYIWVALTSHKLFSFLINEWFMLGKICDHRSANDVKPNFEE